MTITSAADFQAAVKAAAPGTTLELDGNLGAATLSKRQGLTLVPASGAKPHFDSLNIVESEKITLAPGIEIAMPYSDKTTVNSTPALRVYDSHGVDVTGCAIRGAIVPEGAVNAVPSTATALKPGGNVIGLPTGEPVWIGNGSTDVSLVENDIGFGFYGITLSGPTGVTIKGNDIHDIRTAFIAGNVAADILITLNHLSRACPWNWGAGDHGDFIHLRTVAGQAGPTTNVRILTNLMEQLDGVAILGIYLDASFQASPAIPGFDGGEIGGNAIICANAQALRLENAENFVVHDETYLPPEGAVIEPKKLPQIYLRGRFSGQIQNVRTHSADWDQAPAGWLDGLAKVNKFSAPAPGEAAAAVAACLAILRPPPPAPQPDVLALLDQSDQAIALAQKANAAIRAALAK